MEIDVDVTLELGRIQVIPYTTAFATAPFGLAAAAQVGGGTFAAGTYFWVITGTDSLGETTASNEASAAIALNGSCILTWSPLPAGTTGVNVYRGTVAGSENALIATLGAVTTFTDTGAAGSAATPPVTNTAEIGDTVIFTGEGTIVGWSLREVSGTVKAVMEFRDGNNPLGESFMASGAVDTQIVSEHGIWIRSQINVHVVSGQATGVVYVRYARAG